ncbi:MAG: chromate reductase [Saprospiraceae bacterium]|jgi:chromate reductase|tara:strand:+ start:358 stop:894 length:537 start_codon:yes stop_codon:yes gene_type:complete
MIAIISATNRPASRTEFVSRNLFEMIGKYTDEEVNLINLSEVDPGFVHAKMYEAEFQHPDLTKIQDEQIIPADKWIIVSPEYNGSYSGIGKVFVDALSIRKYAETFKGKKLALVGVATGRAGNLRGLDHLTTSFNYLGMKVFPNRLPLANITDHMVGDGFDADTTETLDRFVEGFVSF